MPDYNGFKTNLQLGRLINVSSNWTFINNVEVHPGDIQDTINLTATGIPYHGYGSIYASTVALAEYYNRQWVWRGGKVVTESSTSVGTNLIGFWLNGVAIYPPSIDALPPFGFTTPSGFHFDQSYANGIAQDEIAGGQHWYKQDYAGGRAKTTGNYFYNDYSFAPIWVSGQGGRPYSSTVKGLPEVDVIPYLDGSLFHADGHSKILGFSLDGFPIYGPSGYVSPLNATSGVKNLASSYVLRPSSYRAATTAYDLSTYPMGMFVEDYVYNGSGDLDVHNGRYCVTPDYPSGTYAYFCTVDGSGNPAYPYVIGESWYQAPDLLTVEPAQGYGTGYPEWVTPKGNLGKVQALQFFEIGLQAVDPTGQPDGQDVNYALIAGKLPAGLQIDSSGQVTGNPKSTYSVDGVPQAVTQDRTSSFTIRAYSSSGKITDRSFSITVTGNYPPTLLTSNYTTLGEFVDGILIRIPISAVDLNNDTLTYTLLSGKLPLGTSLSSNGVISGPLIPNYVPPNGWDNDSNSWDSVPFDQTDLLLPPGQTFTSLGKVTYYFTIQVSDGKSFDIKNYSIVVYNHESITADSTLITDDETSFTGDTTNDRRPILLTETMSDYDTFTSGNYFAFKFEGVDYDNVNVGYSVVGTTGTGWDADTVAWDTSPWDQSTFELPPGLSLDSTTGWLTGFVPEQSYVSQTYSFGIQVYSIVDATITSEYRIFSITILGAVSLGITWNTSSDLGIMYTGDTSQLAISATAESGRQLYYSLASGSKIPQGLTLLNDGCVSGRVSFQQFSLDKGTTTFDVTNTANGVTTAPTTIDRTYTFIVNATDYSQDISGQKTFTLTVESVTYEPYDNLYLICLPSVAKRNILTTILGNTDYFKLEDIYRPNDPYWGVQSDLKVLVGYGLTSSQASDYISAMQTRHYNKKFYFGDYHYAQAKDTNGNALYDVVYVDLVEDTKTYTNVNGYLTPNIPQSSFLINDGRRLYPNDLTLMNDDLVVGIGETNTNTLPQWETSIQADGRILGFQTAAVLAYLKPGTGERVLYLLKNNVPNDIKLIPFTADRYIFDNNLDINYDIATGYFYSKQYTTFDTGYILSITPTATVGFALDIPFDRVDGATITQINAIGGLDGDQSGDWDGRTVVFSTQQNYNPTTFPVLYNDGWNQNGAVIPGYAEVQAGTATTNKRGGVWQISISNRTVSLTFLQEIALNDVVLVQLGAKAGETWQYSSANVGVGSQTVPKYEQGDFQTLQLKSPTTFDSANTQFINNQDVYQLPFANDSYLKFPLENILSTAT